MFKQLTAFSIIGLSFLGLAGMAASTPDLGKALTDTDLTSLDIAILPDGQGLPEGKGTAAEGQPVYAVHCASCHGDSGRH